MSIFIYAESNHRRTAIAAEVALARELGHRVSLLCPTVPDALPADVAHLSLPDIAPLAPPSVLERLVGPRVTKVHTWLAGRQRRLPPPARAVAARLTRRLRRLEQVTVQEPRNRRYVAQVQHLAAFLANHDVVVLSDPYAVNRASYALERLAPEQQPLVFFTLRNHADQIPPAGPPDRTS